MEYEQPVVGSFYKSSEYHPAKSPDRDPDAMRQWLAKFRDKKTGWGRTKKDLCWWRKHTVEWLRYPYDLPEQYAFISRLIAAWADAELRIDSTPIRLITEIVVRDYSHIAGGDDLMPDPLLDLDPRQRDSCLRDAILTWERVYDASEAIYSPIRAAEDKGRRPAYARDLLWLRWREDEHLTPAKIRDRWNEMEDVEREVVSPGCPDMVMIETVKTGLKRAAGDRKKGK